jgi:hypothetical protein
MLRNNAVPVLMILATLLVLGPAPARAQRDSDSAFAALQDRGRSAMGVDQYASTHRFDDLPDGGRIELQQDHWDSAGVRAIRNHLKTIARAFAAGDFTTPGLVHAQEVPGARAMAAKHEEIDYEFRPLPRGGEVRMITQDSQALKAIHDFLAFQRREHRAAGAELHHR